MVMIDTVRGWFSGCGLVLLVLVMSGSACDSCSKKPTEAECRAAIENMRAIRGLDQNTSGVDINKAIRSCRGSSTKETAKCLTNAKTEAELQVCEGEDGKEFVDQEREVERKRKEKVDKNAPKDDPDKENKDGE